MLNANSGIVNRISHNISLTIIIIVRFLKKSGKKIMRIQNKLLITALICAISCAGCSSFVADEDAERLAVKYQSGDYILLQDITRNDVTLAKGTVVKLTFVSGDEWVKIYAYDKKEELLTSRRQLLIYMFEDDFPDGEFNQELLETELAKVAQLYGSSAGSVDRQQDKSGKKTK